MDSRQEERNALGDKISALLRGYRLAWTVDGDGDGYPLVDAVTPPDQATITLGIEELENLAGEIAWLAIPAETPNAEAQGRCAASSHGVPLERRVRAPGD